MFQSIIALENLNQLGHFKFAVKIVLFSRSSYRVDAQRDTLDN
jgi:hypothetical protein